MDKQTKHFLMLMNTKNWFRMLVCFMPGIILGKLAASLGASQGVTMASTLLLVFGLVVYAAWNIIRNKFDAIKDDNATGNESMTESINVSESVSDKMSELVALCGGNEQLANNLILVECKLNPDLTYSAAMDIAHRRILLNQQ